LNGTTHLKEPIACTEGERREFARLVRQGFPAAEGLDGRIRDAKWLAFYYAAGHTLGAVAALKAPNEQYREDVFKKADAPVSAADYRLELGWVFVVPAYRGNRIAESLCRLLLARVPTSCVFATTRPTNISMIRILLALGFARSGQPYPRRNEELVLFLRPARPSWRHAPPPNPR
jgi:GNAT superfamily N-acetyltransferase